MKIFCFLACFLSSFFSWSQYIYGSISSGYQLNSKIDQAPSYLVNTIHQVTLPWLWRQENYAFKSSALAELHFGHMLTPSTIQSIAMVPGVSRSAATIIGGLSQKLTRKAAAEFSFFLAVPTMAAATLKSMYDEKELLMQSSGHEWLLLLVGNVVAFIVAYLAIKSFIAFLQKKGFRAFGWYRIALGAVLLLLMAMGVELQMAG